MITFRSGDIVRVTQGSPDEKGYSVQVREVTLAHTSDPQKVSLYKINVLIDSGHTVELIERPSSDLPSTPQSIGWADFDGERHIAVSTGPNSATIFDHLGITASCRLDSLSNYEPGVLIPESMVKKLLKLNNREVPYATLAQVQEIALFLESEYDLEA